MCGRYALTQQQGLEALFDGLVVPPDFVPRYNIAPTQPILAIRRAGGGREAWFARWGLVPGWVKDPRDFPLLVNARAETMAAKPAFRDSLRNQRCLVPASGYYEWRTGPDGAKTPFYITRADGAPMAMAGLYATCAGPNGEEIDSVALVTTEANAELAPIHHRMPVILEGQAARDWLDTAAIDSRAASVLARPLGEGQVRFHPVSPRVNNARNEGPDLVDPVTDPSQTAPAKPLRARQKDAGQLDLF